MAGMGPAPKPKDQRRNRTATVPMTQLPAGGRPGRAPSWPLADSEPAELKLWRDLWKMPQAVVWDQQGSHREVAQYVRFKILAEGGNLKAAAEARQMSDRLGLTPLAMLRLRWEIAADEVGAKRAERSGRTRPRAVEAS